MYISYPLRTGGRWDDYASTADDTQSITSKGTTDMMTQAQVVKTQIERMERPYRRLSHHLLKYRWVYTPIRLYVLMERVYVHPTVRVIVVGVA